MHRESLLGVPAQRPGIGIFPEQRLQTSEQIERILGPIVRHMQPCQFPRKRHSGAIVAGGLCGSQRLSQGGQRTGVRTLAPHCTRREYGFIGSHLSHRRAGNGRRSRCGGCDRRRCCRRCAHRRQVGHQRG